MVHDSNSEAAKLIAERKKLKNQFLQFDKATIVGIPVDEWTPYFHTNNFFQRTLAHTLGFDDTNQKFRLLQVDSSGNLKVSQTVSVVCAADFNGTNVNLKANALNALLVDPSGRDLTIDSAIVNQSVPGSGNITHNGIDVSHAAKITCLVSTTAACTVRVQISDDNINWYEFVDETDTARTYSVNNQKKAFRIENAAKFLRLFVTNDTASAVTVNAVVLGQG